VGVDQSSDGGRRQHHSQRCGRARVRVRRAPAAVAALCASLLNASSNATDALRVPSGHASSNATGAEHGAAPTDAFVRVPSGHAYELRGCAAEGLWGVALRVELGTGAWFVVGGASPLHLGERTLHGASHTTVCFGDGQRTESDCASGRR